MIVWRLCRPCLPLTREVDSPKAKTEGENDYPSVFLLRKNPAPLTRGAKALRAVNPPRGLPLGVNAAPYKVYEPPSVLS